MLPSLRSHKGLYSTFSFKEQSYQLKLLNSGTPFEELSNMAAHQFPIEDVLLVVYAAASEAIHDSVRRRTAVIIHGSRAILYDYPDRERTDNSFIRNEIVSAFWVYRPGKVCECFSESELTAFHVVPRAIDCVLVCAN